MAQTPETPETRYATTGDGVHIAYQVAGEGGHDLVLIDQWFSNVDLQWEFPPLARFIRRLSSFARVITFDKRGTGLSDPVGVRALPTIEEWMDDLRAVLDAVESDRANLVACVAGAYMTMLFAATYPERTSALVCVDAFASALRRDDYPWGLDPAILRENVKTFDQRWGRGVTLDFLGPGVEDEETRRSYARYERNSASPGVATAMLEMIYDSDVRPILPAIRVPTLVIGHRDAPRLPIAHSRYLAEHIAGAKLLELPGVDNFVWTGDQELLAAEIQEFLTGDRPAPDSDRVLATVLFTDIVASTKRLAELGDAKWREVLSDHHALVRRELTRFRGREIDTAGDGFFATFDGPARAIRCAQAIRDGIRRLGIDIRAGLHTGELELTGEAVGGIAVHIGARVAAHAGAGEVLVSRTVADLVAGSGIAFADRGEHELKGVPGTWRLFAVEG